MHADNLPIIRTIISEQRNSIETAKDFVDQTSNKKVKKMVSTTKYMIFFLFGLLIPVLAILRFSVLFLNHENEWKQSGELPLMNRNKKRIVHRKEN